MEILTSRIEKAALDYIHKIDEMGGMIQAIEKGFPQAEIANSAYHFQRQLESKEKVMVGVNKFQMKEKARSIDTLYIDRSIEEQQVQKLAQLRKSRSPEAHQTALRQIKEAAQAGKNLMEPVLGAVKAYATLQEICDTLRPVFGEYRESGSF